MSDFPKPSTIKAAAEKIAKDFQDRVSSIVRVEADPSGKIAVLVHATTAAPPGFPRALNVRAANGSRYTLPIVWKLAPAAPEGVDMDEGYWAGASPVVDRAVRMWEPGLAPVIPVLENIPPTDQENRQLSIGGRLPQFATPNFWSIPFDQEGSVCIPFYERWDTAFRYKVPSDRMVIITGISYEFDDTLVTFDQFDIQILRDTEDLSTFRDMRALNTADPAEEYVLAGHYRPMQFYGRFDHDQEIIARVKVRGQYPFTHTKYDTLGGCFHIFLSGWMASLMDNRDGGARPVDMGSLNQLALGENP